MTDEDLEYEAASRDEERLELDRLRARRETRVAGAAIAAAVAALISALAALSVGPIAAGLPGHARPTPDLWAGRYQWSDSVGRTFATRVVAVEGSRAGCQNALAAQYKKHKERSLESLVKDPTEPRLRELLGAVCAPILSHVEALAGEVRTGAADPPSPLPLPDRFQ